MGEYLGTMPCPVPECRKKKFNSRCRNVAANTEESLKK